jgi:putative copper export protein
MPDRASMAERYSSRKFGAVMFWQAVITGLLLMDKLAQEHFVTLTMALLVGYLVVNSAQHVLESRQ